MDLAAQRLRDASAARLEASCPWIVHVSSMVYTRPSKTANSKAVSVTRADVMLCELLLLILCRAASSAALSHTGAGLKIASN